jgi:hypothetical protein
MFEFRRITASLERSGCCAAIAERLYLRRVDPSFQQCLSDQRTHPRLEAKRVTPLDFD